MEETTKKVTLKRPGKIPEELVVSHGDGLRYIGTTDRARCPHLSNRVLFSKDGKPDPETGERSSTHVLVGPPPQGCTDDDLHAAGIGTTVTLAGVGFLTPSGQWEHVPASSMKELVAEAVASRDERVEAHAAEQGAKVKKATKPKP